MSEFADIQTPYSLSQKMMHAAGLTLAGAVIGMPTALGIFTENDRETTIATTEVSLSPNFDGEINIESGPVPEMRYPVELPFNMGVDAYVGTTTMQSSGSAAVDVQRLQSTYGAILAQPAGEKAQVAKIIKDQALFAAEIGLGAGLLPTGLYHLLGRRRREELAAEVHRARTLTMVGTLAVVTSCGYVAMPNKVNQETAWQTAAALMPELAQYPEAHKLEVRDNAITGVGIELISGAFQTFEDAKRFYGDLEAKVPSAAWRLHVPESGQKVAVFLSDRHDNINMDPIHRAMADQAGATILILGGDDTSSGQKWEEFSLRSVNKEFDDYTYRAAIDGNHKTGSFVIDYFQAAGFMTPNGELQSLDDIPVLLANDPRESSFTPERREGQMTFQEATDEVTKAACESETRPALLVVHDIDQAAGALEQGCVDLAVAGHTHVLTNPEAVVGQNNTTGYKQTNGSSGAATYAFALVGKPRREATQIFITFEDEQPVGTQSVTYTTDGQIVVGSYIPLLYNELVSSPQTSSSKRKFEAHATVRDGRVVKLETKSHIR